MPSPGEKSVQVINQDFNFDWNDYKTFDSIKAKIATVEAFIAQTLPSLDKLDHKDKYAFGQLCFKLGAFYNHITRDPNKALEKLSIAQELLDGVELAWVQNHLAFTYQQKLAASMKQKNVLEAQEIAKLAANYCVTISYRVTEETYHTDRVKIKAFSRCVSALIEYELGHLNDAISIYEIALKFYESISEKDDQYARALNRYAQFLGENKDYIKATKAFQKLEAYWQQKADNKTNPYAARFYVSYATYMESRNPELTQWLLTPYSKALEILKVTEGEQSPFTKEISKKVTELQDKKIRIKFDNISATFIDQLKAMPFSARQPIIESFSSLLLRELVPMSGVTLQQQIPADPEQVAELDALMNQTPYSNGRDEIYAYQFPREASAASIMPMYKDKKTGELYVGMVCNSRNENMYNWPAGYINAPIPRWNDKLRSVKNQALFYDPKKAKESATSSMVAAVHEAKGNWAETTLDYHLVADGFKKDGVILPNTDLDSRQTAWRKCLEEMNLNLDEYPQLKIFDIPYSNMVGISHGDAPGQMSNHNTLTVHYLGELDTQPPIAPGGEVTVANWVKVSDIQRVDELNYKANGKELCIYMLQGIELGLKQLWSYFLQQASMQKTNYGNRLVIARFSTPENVLAEIETYCAKNKIDIKDTLIPGFFHIISGDLPSQTYTGSFAQMSLDWLLQTAQYLTSPRLNPATFISDMTKILSPKSFTPKYSTAAHAVHFGPKKAEGKREAQWEDSLGYKK